MHLSDSRAEYNAPPCERSFDGELMILGDKARDDSEIESWQIVWEKEKWIVNLVCSTIVNFGAFRR